MTTPGELASMDTVTNVREPTTAPARTARSAAAADDAMLRAGVRVRELTTLDELVAVCRMYDEIWRPGPETGSPLTPEMLRALVKAGNYIVGAFDATTGAMVGACVGFFGAPADASLHSHVAGVTTAARGRGVGLALKLHQRAWALRRGVKTITWTFDPLVRRNAHFNITKLAGRPVEYLTNFYGIIRDAINADEESDRLLLRWDLDTDAVHAACAGLPDGSADTADGAVIALGVGGTGRPHIGPLAAPKLLVAVPQDIEALRISDPAMARDWRMAVREVLGGLLARGARVTGFDRDGGYVVATTDEGGAAACG